jgi:membrane fusion protein (multidrug efflux system)
LHFSGIALEADTMETNEGRGSETASTARPIVPEGSPPESREPAAHRDVTAHPDHQATEPVRGPARAWRRWVLVVAAVAGLAIAGYYLRPTVERMLNTVSTDDAYVNGHVTFVAPRVAGQVSRVYVDDNYRVKRGALLVQLDKEPYQVQVAIRKSAVASAEADLVAAQAQVRALVAQGRANRYQLERAIEDVDTQIANLRANVATLSSRRATLALSRNNLRRGEELVKTGGISKEELDQRTQTVKVDEAAVDQALQQVYATRVGLGQPAQPPAGKDLTYVPDNLDQTFSSVTQAVGQLQETAAQFGYSASSWEMKPKELLDEFYKQDPGRNVDKIMARLIPNAPGIKQAEAKLQQARADLDDALLNLRYCDIVSEIDGVVTRRNVNPGNNISVGQSLMAVRSLTEIWIDANFKETQLADLRIGHRVGCEVDMYGSRREYEGRITGFTMGTGQTLALLPPQNATGNFVKIVQRLPVRIELTDYDPDKAPLFVGLSVVPYVYYKERPTGPHAGEMLQPIRALPQGPVVSISGEASPSVFPVPKGPSGP